MHEQVRCMLLPGFAASSSFSLFNYIFLESGLRFFLSPLSSFFHLLSSSVFVPSRALPPLLSSVLFVCIPFILKSVLELTRGCLFPPALNWRLGKRRLQFPQGARQSSVSVLFLNMHLNVADQRSKRSLWVLSTRSS